MKNRKEYDRFRGRIYRTANAFKLTLESCPEMGSIQIQLSDNREIYAFELLAVLEKLYRDAWKFGPPEVQKKQAIKIALSQPVG